MPAGLTTAELVASLARMAGACEAVGDEHGAQLAGEAARRLEELLAIAREVARLEDLSRVWDGALFTPGPILPASRKSLIERSRVFWWQEAGRRGVSAAPAVGREETTDETGARVVRFVSLQSDDAPAA